MTSDDPSAPHALTPEESARLREVAFGRTTSPADEARAVDARRTLARAEAAKQSAAAADAEAEAVAKAEAAAEAERARASATPAPVDTAGAGGADAEQHPGSDHPESVRPRRLLPVGLAFAAGAVIAGVTVGAFISSSPPPPPETRTDVIITDGFPVVDPMTLSLGGEPVMLSPRGDVEAAEAVFAAPQEPDDLIPAEHMGDPIFEPSSTRQVYSDAATTVYVAKSADGGYCLIAIVVAATMGFINCAEAPDFEDRGLASEGSGEGRSYLATWDGNRAILSYTTP